VGEAEVNEPGLTPSLIRSAYANGWFPMADEDGSLAWYQPQNRALFPIEGIHVSHSLFRKLKRAEFEIRYDTAFEQVIRACQRPDENWINAEIIRAYTEIHYEGWAHSVEVFRNDEMIGGLYGLALGRCFSAESMFHRQTDASKIALWAAVEHCRNLGFTLFDAQVMNPHLASLGAFEISMEDYLDLLAEAMRCESPWKCRSLRLV